MAAVSCLLSEEQLLCSVCLQLISEPVSIPCGHNFCKACITQHWDNCEQCKCPLCSKVFNTRPEVHVNTLFSEIICQLKYQSQKEANLSGVSAEHKVKSCETHLTVSDLKGHQPIEPAENLETRKCPEHYKPLEFFCCTDHTCVCTICALQEHKYHDVVPLKEEYEKQKASLQNTEAETQQMVDEKRLQIQEIQQTVELSQEAADKEIATGLQAFTGLMQCVQENRDQFIKKVQEKRRQDHKRAQNLVHELEQEICDLQKRSTEVERLSRSEDHLHFLQSFTSLKPLLAPKERNTWSFKPASFEGTAARALSELQDTVSEEFNELFRTELRRVQQFAVDITLDRDTANPYLSVSKDLKQVYCVDVQKVLSVSGKWVSDYFNVLGKESFSSGRFYFEVQVKGKTDWDIGVANKSINRKNKITFVPQNGYWCIFLRNGNQYKALADPSVCLSLTTAPQKVGVFVDYDGGLVSFHDADTAAFIYVFTDCCFKAEILPYFSPGLNSRGTNFSPLIITDPDLSDCESIITDSE